MRRRSFAAAVLVAALAAQLTWSSIPASAEPAGGGGEPSAAVVEAQAAQVTAALTGQLVELESQRTETSRTFVDGAGVRTLEQHSSPQWVQTDDGWTDVDTTLSVQPDGSVAPAAAAIDLRFSGGGSDPLATVAADGTAVAFDWSGSLPTPTLVGDTATYAEVLPGVDLRVRALADSFAEVLVVKTAAAAAQPELAELAFPTTVSGGTLHEDAGGGFHVADAEGRTTFASPQPLMWDGADSAAAIWTPDPGAQVAELEAATGDGAITVVPDAGLLGSASADYPLVIDPVVAAPRQQWAMVDSSFPTTSYYKWGGDEGVGYYTGPEGVFTKRLYWQFDTSPVAGKKIIDAVFKPYETWAYSCTPSQVNLLLTNGAIGSGTTWNNKPGGTYLTQSTMSYGRDGCTNAMNVSADDTRVDFPSIASTVQDGANDHRPTTTLSLQASETSTSGWKRFRYDAILMITYDSLPAAPTGVRTTSPDTTCEPVATKPYVNDNTPTLRAVLADADTGDNVSGQFEWWKGATRIGHSESGGLPGGTEFTYQLGVLPDGVDYFWRVRGKDSAGFYGDWSPSCNFAVDATPPTGSQITTVTSATYNSTTPATTGSSGAFTFTAPDDSALDSDVMTFRYGFNSDSGSLGRTVTAVHDMQAHTWTAATPPWSPPAYGPNWVMAQLTDRAGNVYAGPGAVTPYVFLVSGASNPQAQYRLDETSGTTLASTVVGGGPLTATTTAIVGADGREHANDPTDHALELSSAAVPASQASGAAVLHSDRSFTVMAWLRPSTTPAGNMNAVVQEATAASGWTLGYAGSATAPQFMFGMARTNVAAPAYALAKGGTAAAGGWVHVTGVYDTGYFNADGSHGAVLLYIGTDLVQTVPYFSTFDSFGTLHLGLGKYNGNAASGQWNGDVDEVLLFQGALTQDQIRGYAQASRTNQ